LAFAGTLNLLTHFTNHFITCHCIYHSSHLHVRQLLLLLLLFDPGMYDIISWSRDPPIALRISTRNIAICCYSGMKGH